MSDLPVSREALHATFGAQAFALGLFYAHEPALRIALSGDGHWLDRFEQAWDRAREIADHALGDAPELVVVLTTFQGDTPLENRALFRSLRRCGVRTGGHRAWWLESYQDEWMDQADPRFYAAFACGREALHRLLWGGLARELGVRPRLAGDLFIADPARGIVLHPYDDRGMDVIGPRDALLELYHRFSDHLLDYDRERMDAFFASADSSPTAA
ncbi:MAG TPA: DUF3885 domain-containing protein [Longimicrobium sp.]|nr:DUF3885 domain-containing protein [Longimicrobium sp.]